MYKVIKAFYDLTYPVKVKVVKGGIIPVAYHFYRVGDVFPANNAPAPSEERIAQLTSGDNKQGRPLIEEVAEPVGAVAELPAETVEEKPKKKAAPKRKRTTRKKADADGGTGNT